MRRGQPHGDRVVPRVRRDVRPIEVEHERLGSLEDGVELPQQMERRQPDRVHEPETLLLLQILGAAPRGEPGGIPHG